MSESQAFSDTERADLRRDARDNVLGYTGPELVLRYEATIAKRDRRIELAEKVIVHHEGVRPPGCTCEACVALAAYRKEFPEKPT